MISIEHVTKVYPNGTVGVEDININIEKVNLFFLSVQADPENRQ